MSLDKFIETSAEMMVLAAVMFLAAFFCFRIVLLPKAAETTIEKVYEVEGALPEE